MKYTDVMIDLETLGRRPSSVVLSIGACCFSEERGPMLSPFYAVLNRIDQTARGRHVGAGTVAWWDEQSIEARAVFRETQWAVTDALEALNSHLLEYLPEPEQRFVWGNDPSFDMSILHDLYRHYGVEWPFGHRSPRCYRTIKALFPEEAALAESQTKRICHHHAGDDARYQAEVTTRLLRRRTAALNLCEAAGACVDPEGNLPMPDGPERFELEAAISAWDGQPVNV